MIITIDIREEAEEEQGMDQVDEVFMEHVITMDNKGIGNLNVLRAKEGQIGELKAMLELCRLMKMANHHIMKMLKDEKSQLTKESC